MKNLHSTRWLSLLVLTGLLAGFTASRADDAPGEVIFSGKDSVRPNWIVSGWGGVTTETATSGGRTPGTGYATTKLDPKSEPYSGFSLHVNYGQDAVATSIPLTPELIASGAVEFYINSGKPVAGSENDEIKVKFILMFVTKDGKQVPAPWDTIMTLDNDKTTWEVVHIPLASVVAKLPDPTAIIGVYGVNVQYVDAPTSEVRVTDAYLKSK